MKPFAAGLCATLLTCALTSAALAASASFTETESYEDGLFHIDVGAEYAQAGQPPRDDNSGIGTIKVSLPGASARFDSALQVDQDGYSCQATRSAYGEAGTGFVCSSDGQVRGAGLAFPTAVTVHLLSDDCYAPPAAGSAQPAIAELWAAPGDPGTSPDARITLTGDPGCDDAVDDPPVDVVEPLRCLVPRVTRLTLAAATRKLRRQACRRGRVRYAYSAKVPRGRVVSQSARPGRRLRRRARIGLVVSKGTKPAR